MFLLYSSRRPPPPLKDIDYDHEIKLVDNTLSENSSSSRNTSSTTKRTRNLNQSSRKLKGPKLCQRQSPFHLREELTRRKFAKYQDPGFHKKNKASSSKGSVQIKFENSIQVPEDRGRRRSESISKKRILNEGLEFAVDVLFENQRGGFMCGRPLFSARALGNLDPAPWTNIAQKPSATDITNAQTPDPTWQWVGKEWTIYQTEEIDKDGWLYSFAFHGKFSWHKGRWWNSFVRRRAWIRKRVKKKAGYRENEISMFNTEYFNIQPLSIRHRIQEMSSGGKNCYRSSISHCGREQNSEIVENNHDITNLTETIRFARIDREITEAIEYFIKNGREDLVSLEEQIQEIMQLYIFQASRRNLLLLLVKILNETIEKGRNAVVDGDTNERNSVEHLNAVVRTAQKEVFKFEFWNNLNDVTQKGLYST